MAEKRVWIFDERSGNFRQVGVSRCKTSANCHADQVKFWWCKAKWYYAYYGRTHREAWERATNHLRLQIAEHEKEIETCKYLIKTTYGPEPEKTP
jgi:hypothetical protein